MPIGNYNNYKRNEKITDFHTSSCYKAKKLDPFGSNFLYSHSRLRVCVSNEDEKYIISNI